LLANVEALKSHEEFSTSSGHDMNTMYPQFANQGGSGGGYDDAYGDSTGADSDYDIYEDGDDETLNDDAFAPSPTVRKDARASPSSSPSPAWASASTAKLLIQEALDLAQAGDMMAALPVFERAVRADPQDRVATENLGVTLMRLGLLRRAREQLSLARQLHQGQPGGASKTLADEAASLEKNFQALAEHEAYAKEIGHDLNTVYEEYLEDTKDQGSSTGTRSSSAANAASVTADGYVSAAPMSPADGRRAYSFVVDLSRPLGAGIDQDARVDSVKDGGQFATGRAAVGDQVGVQEMAKLTPELITELIGNELV
jgi:tetratricopeptide (TPR) repeat protein